jgi:hypothetical protein
MLDDLNLKSEVDISTRVDSAEKLLQSVSDIARRIVEAKPNIDMSV